ncbi:IclR family transcriptional regulator [Nocardia pseudobrasiliensis]|uniref:Glycerol operon regulatory protein n=1 Tax=Nocardia pseudobrasiliensis TaxID=45979 RepID=A0A370HYV8_9NOCA|nr:helix-turn-helix domain-containing protein [Nocardia pseudobrasiliensis]RDI63649.1 IclR family transcriptional regulator [Nocardia pseudobrasiliensis]
MTVTDEPRSGARAVDRAVAVLNCFEGDDPELSVSELAHLAGLPVSTTHRLAQALVRGRLLEQDPASDRYRIGHGLASLARPALSRLGLDSAAPHLYALAAGIRITVSVSVAEESEAVTVFQARPPIHFCHNQVPRARRSLETSAVGRALLAFSPAEGVRHAELDRVRRIGFASELIEAEDPVRALAVPIVGPDRRVRGALGVQARSVRLNDELVRGVVPAMRAIAARVGPLLGPDAFTADVAAAFGSH